MTRKELETKYAAACRRWLDLDMYRECTPSQWYPESDKLELAEARREMKQLHAMMQIKVAA